MTGTPCVPSSVKGTFAPDDAQPTGTALLVTETSTFRGTAKTFLRLEVKRAN